MKTRNIIHIILAFVIAINITLMLALKPFTTHFYAMSLFNKIIYTAMMCGWPVLVLVPIALILLPVAAIPGRNRAFRDRYLNLIGYTFLVVSLLIFLINSYAVIAKYAFGKKFFEHELYADIRGTDENTDDLRNGHFRGLFSYITRQDSVQIETDIKTGRITEFSVSWLSPNEYRLIRRKGNNYGMNDTLLVKITTNLPDRYDCYLKYGEYAQPAVVYKE